MREPRHLTNMRASMACYGTVLLFIYEEICLKYLLKAYNTRLKYWALKETYIFTISLIIFLNQQNRLLSY
jgi:hypothetical protein